MSTPTNSGSALYNWADDKGSGMSGSSQTPKRPAPSTPAPPPPSAPPSGGNAPSGGPQRNYHLHVGGNGGGNQGGGGTGGGQAAAGAPGGNHQGDGMISAIERIEFRSEKDILALAKAVNRLGRELHFILGMRAEEIQGVLSTYKGKWYTFGASSRVKARLVAMHLKVSAEAAKALGVGALKMAHAFDRHFVKPEEEAKRQRKGQTARREFTIGEG